MQILRFLVVGLINTVVYYLLYGLFLYLGMDYKISIFLATLTGVIFNFQSFGRYVFYSSNNLLIYRFAIVYLLLFFINVILTGIFDIFIKNYYISGFIAIFPYATISFYLNKNFVFKQKSSQ